MHVIFCYLLYLHFLLPFLSPVSVLYSSSSGCEFLLHQFNLSCWRINKCIKFDFLDFLEEKKKCYSIVEVTTKCQSHNYLVEYKFAELFK